MLHGCSLVLLLCSTMAMLLPSSSLIAERSGNIPVVWNVVPSLEAEQEVIVDRGSSERTQVTGVDKALQISDTKEPTKATAEQTNPGNTTREKTPDFIPENVENETHLPKIVKDTAINPVEGNIINDNVVSSPRNVENETHLPKIVKDSAINPVEGNIINDNAVSSPRNVENETHLPKIVKDSAINPVEGNIINDNAVSSPRNVVLLLISKSGQDPENFWQDFQASHAFSVDGYLQSCHNTEIEAARFSLDDALVSGSKGKECDCEHFLRSNVAALLFWARDVKGMATGTLSNTNFTIPSSPRYEEPVAITRELDEADENNARSEIHRDWHVIDSGKPANRASSSVFTPNSREDGPDEAAWNVFDAFSRIRVALFRSLVESLGGAIAGETSPSHRSHFVSSNLAEIVSELKSIQSEKGFVLVAVTPVSEVASAIELLQREVSQDTLLVVAGMCSHDTKPIRFLAQGPAAKTLREASTIWDLPTIIRGAIASRCQGLGCRIHLREALPLPIAQLKLIPQNTFPERRISRNTSQILDNENKILTAASSKVEEVKKPQDLKLNAGKEATEKESEKRAPPEIDARNSTAGL